MRSPTSAADSELDRPEVRSFWQRVPCKKSHRGACHIWFRSTMDRTKYPVPRTAVSRQHLGYLAQPTYYKISFVNFGRAWAGYGYRKCFDSSCRMQNSSQQILSQLLNSSASSFATLSPLLSSNVSSYVVNDSSAFEARRAANFLFNQKCLVIDLVNRNVTFWAVCV